MKLDEFITNVLLDIDKGIISAKQTSNKKYHVNTTDNNGVLFDIAVTAANSTDSIAEGSAKIGFVQVVGAGLGSKSENKTENSQISRIQFTINVPKQTETESKQQREEEERQIQKNNEENRNRWAL